MRNCVEISNNNKRVKIVEINDNKVIAKRTLIFTTIMGRNSVGSEILYSNFIKAVEKEKNWVKE